MNLKKHKIRKKANNQQGFTLLEILVVLTIMGFLIAMVAPRLASVGNDAVDTVCDTNQNRTVTYLSTYFQQSNGSLPNNLTNLVSADTSNGNIYAPEISDGDPDDGNKGVLANEFGLRNNLSAHTLNAAEAAELAGLGIENLFNLNDPEDARTDDPFMAPVTVGAGTVVAMVGMGSNSTSADLALTSGNQIEDDASATSIEEHGWGEPAWLGRIVLGIGPESALITDGIISNAAHCPGGLQNDDNCSYNDYNVVVPRLGATVDRLPTAGIFNSNATTQAVAYMEGDLDTTTAYDLGNNDDKLMIRTVRLTAQEGWQYLTQCPEGHVYPESHDFWAIDLNHDGSINP